MQNRRDFLKMATALTGVAGAGFVMPESVQRAFAIEPTPGSSFTDAEHVVILMQENRSFDHALGTLQGVRGFNDPRAIRQANGNSVFLQTNAAGETYAPWRLDIKDTKVTWMGSIPHTRQSQVDAWNSGNHNNWVDAKHSHNAAYATIPLTMGHYTRDDLPFYYALADAFTVCDQHYCGAMTSTTPNRCIFWTGTVRDEQNVGSKVYMRNEEIDKGGMSWKTFPERLSDAGVNWKFYQNELTHGNTLKGEEHQWLSNFGCNVLEFFGAFHAPTAKELHDRAFVINSGDSNFHTLEAIDYEENGVKQSMKVPKGDILHQFREDVNNGKLPTISWLSAPEKFSDHPTAPWFGAWYVSEVVDILTKNPEVWKKTIFILTYDENDGYFDHAPSFVAADPKRAETGRASAGIDTGLEYTYAADELRQDVAAKSARGGPIGLGFRVPMIIASPWSRGGWVNSQVFDHSSTLQFLEQFVAKKYGKRVEETNISPWRRTVSGNLTSVFRPYDGKKEKLPFLDRDKFVLSIQHAKYKELPSNFVKLNAQQIAEVNSSPLSSQLTAHQEKGIRPASALPYELYADGVLGEKGFELRMTAGNSVHGAQSAGSPFNVYLHNTHTGNGLKRPVDGNANMLSATYVVKAGDTLRQGFPLGIFADGKYDIDVHGPNGFFRSFRGNAKATDLVVSADYERKGSTLTGNVQVKLRNNGKIPMTVDVSDNAYKTGKQTKQVAPGAEELVTLNLSKQHGWYDFTVKSDSVKAESRYAGRVETGRASFSDPVMGGVI